MNDQAGSPAVSLGRYAAFPITRAFKRFDEGRKASLVEFYEWARTNRDA